MTRARPRAPRPPPRRVSSVSLCECDGFGTGVAIKAYVKARMAPRHALNLRRELAILSELRAAG